MAGGQMKYPRYPAYKPSGMPWLGEIPAHWDVKRLKYAVEYVNRKTDSFPEGSVYYAMENIESWTGKLLMSETEIVPESQTNTFKADDVLFGKLRPYLAKAFQTETEGCCSTELLVLRGRLLKPSFIKYCCLSRGFIETVDGSTFGSKMPRANWDFIGNLPNLIPPFDEQAAIATFLDRETTRIDSLIEKKQRFIELLQEKRSALISHAVTRGLNPAAELKDSGIEWLGRIPAHWEVVSLGRKITLQRGVDITKEEQVEGDIPVVSSGGISSYHDTPLAKGPGVLVGRKGTAGAVHYVDTDYWPHDTTLWVKEFGDNSRRYIYYKLVSMNLASFDTGSSNPTVNRNLVHPVKVSWPPRNEQESISTYLDYETARLDNLRTKVESAIDRLKEYRTALITAAVTGKIDVREAA